MILEANDQNINICAQGLLSGELVAIPTETVYGLAASALDENASAKIYKIKGRPSNNPLIVHFFSVDQILSLLPDDISKKIKERLVKLATLWPGPVSAIIPKPDCIANSVCANGETVAVRIPDHPIALRLLKAVNIPLAAPSANKSLKVSPTTAQHVEESFSKENIKILNGGSCKIGIESTVLDLTSDNVRILRPGAIDNELVEQLLGEKCFLDYAKNDGDEVALPSPGLLGKHYSPETKLLELSKFDFSKNPNLKIGIILFSEDRLSEYQKYSSTIEILSKDADLLEVASKLYAGIRKLDALGLDIILIDRCASTGIGYAIMDRINRALAG